MSTAPKFVYRIVVSEWPTENGRPWPRFVRPEGAWDFPAGRTLADHPWLATIAESAIVDNEFAQYHDNWNGETVLDGWLLPNPKTCHYISRHAAYEWVRRAAILGAKAHVEVGRVGWGAQ